MPPSSFWCTVCKSLLFSHSKHSSALDVNCFLSSILTFQPLKMLWTSPIATVPEGGWAWRHAAWPISPLTVAYAPGGSGAPSQKVVTGWKSQNLHSELNIPLGDAGRETGRIFGNSRWVGIFCAKDVVHFVRVLPPPPPVLVLPVPAWASMLVICCRWLFFALKQLLARLASILCNRRLSELRVQLLMLLCQISACRYARSKGWTQTLTSQIVVGVMVPFLEHDIEYHGLHGLLNLVVSWRHSMIWAKPQTWRIRGCYFDDG